VQIDAIANATPKHDYYYHSPLGSRLFCLDVGPLAEAFLCVSRKADVMRFNKLFSETDPGWLADWLRYKKLPEWAAFVENNYV